MSGPTKILPFRRPDHPVGLHLVRTDVAAFPRFQLEWNRPHPRPGDHPADRMPPTGK